MILSGFTELIAERMRAEHRVLAARWFERLLDLLPVDARHVFPTESLLDHIPALILEVAGYLREPDDQAIAANTTILEKARELGELRHGQRASLHQVLREYQVLNGVLVAFVVEEMERLNLTPPPVESVSLVSRLNQAVHLLSQSTVESFVTLYTRTIAEQNERLEQFTRMAAHEWRQPVGALLFGINLLTRSDLDAQQTERTLSAVERNVQHLIELTRKLEVLARVQDRTDGPIVQEVSAGTVAREAARQLREMAHARGVEVRIANDMPTLTVDVGRLELALLNLLSNAIKYSDAAKPERYVDVRGGAHGAWCRLEIRDNGVGIPDEALPRVFQRFTRAHTERDDLLHVGGIGLGLSITEDCVRAMGGQIDVHSVEREGTAFVLTLPLTPAVG